MNLLGGTSRSAGIYFCSRFSPVNHVLQFRVHRVRFCVRGGGEAWTNIAPVVNMLVEHLDTLMVFLGSVWDGGSVLTDYMCTGASVCVLTGEVPVINNLLVGAPTNFSLPFVKAGFLTTFHRVADGNCQGTTTVAGLPLHLSSKSNGRGRGGVNSRQRFLCVHNFDCVWHLVSTVSKCFTICALDICGRASAGKKKARSARRKDFPLWKVTTANCPTTPLQSGLRGGVALMPRQLWTSI